MGDDPDKIRKIAEALAPAYSAAHGKTFTVPEDFMPSREHGVDFILRSEDGTVVQFQHTQPSGDVEAERVRPAKADKVIAALKKAMNERRVFGVFVSLNFHTLPNQKDADLIASYLCSFIVQKVRPGFRYYFTYDQHDHQPGLLNSLKGWISRLDILPSQDPNRAVLGWSSDPLGAGSNAVMPDDIKFKEAVDRKSGKYGSMRDVVLVIEFDPYPVDDIYIGIIRDDTKNATYPFREIWAVNNPLGDGKCWKVWPWAGGDDKEEGKA
jgi:hypothetical protein